jgi:hypothetical protein
MERRKAKANVEMKPSLIQASIFISREGMPEKRKKPIRCLCVRACTMKR